MRLPESFDSITLSAGGENLPWAPQGFHGIEERELGNGDVFGLYWPFGLEDREPIVAHTYHDEGLVAPYWSSLEKFLSVAGDDEASTVWQPTLALDANSPEALLASARESLSRSDVAACIANLETAVRVLPEFAAAQTLLASQYRRMGRGEDAIRAAIQALISPVCFWPPLQQLTQLLQWLSQQSTCPDDARNDLIWAHRARLKYKFGGEKENDDYVILKEAIDAYLANSHFAKALTLMETYRQLMRHETVSFQERYAYDAEGFRAWQNEIAAVPYGKSRILDLPEAEPRGAEFDGTANHSPPKRSQPWWKFW